MTTKPHLLLTISILTGALAAEVWSDHREPEVLAKPLDSISRRIDGWTSTRNQKLGDTIVATLDATSYLSRTYRKGPDELDVFTAFYARQKAGESMHSPKYCLPGVDGSLSILGPSRYRRQTVRHGSIVRSFRSPAAGHCCSTGINPAAG